MYVCVCVCVNVSRKVGVTAIIGVAFRFLLVSGGLVLSPPSISLHFP